MVRRDGVRLARRCWLPEESVGDLRARCVAVLDTCAGDSLIAAPTAGQVHALWLPPLPEHIHVAAAQPGRASRSMTRTQRPEFRAHRRMLSEIDRTMVEGVAVTSLARTWVDLASLLRLPDLVAAGDSALRSGCTVDELLDVLNRSAHQRGVRRARQALPMLDARSRSRPESHLRVAVSGADMPTFQVNQAVHRDDGGWLAEPDLSLTEAKLALEYQGEDHADVKRMRKDLTRSKDMRDEGWLVLAYGPAEVLQHPWQIKPEVRAAIRERAPHLLRRAAH